MKAPSFPTGAAAFHALALAFFVGCDVWLVHEARALAGRQGTLGLAVAIAAGALALLALRTLLVLVHARAAVPLRSRTFAESYFQVLAGVGVLVVVGVRFWVLGGRPALVTFCLGLAVWLLMMGLHLVPALLLVRDGFIDHLGRRTRFSELEWFSLQKAPVSGDEPPRALLRAGRGYQLRLRIRLVGPDAEGVRRALVDAGVASRPAR
jgi:hypothetical protein